MKMMRGDLGRLPQQQNQTWALRGTQGSLPTSGSSPSCFLCLPKWREQRPDTHLLRLDTYCTVIVTETPSGTTSVSQLQLTLHAHSICGHIHSKKANYCCEIQAHLAFIRVCHVFPGATRLSVLQGWKFPRGHIRQQRGWGDGAGWLHLVHITCILVTNFPFAKVV